ncbi:YQA3-like protein [Mya arenaria]|uniref:YQA3-like protein n=1 Tax=Mya arenaria TaxID=6604 RepID=A0ABY7FTH0_MYAAR|nr:YQA3-like protein [Mya arenaria]
MAEQQVESQDHHRKIAIAIDESEHSQHALQCPAVVDQLLKELTNKVAALEKKYKALVQEKKLTGKFRTGQGKPGEVICRISEEEKCVLVVTGTRGLGTVRRTFLGSVSDYIIHHSHVPVLVARSKAPHH